MSKLERTRRQQLLREAEGYLELLTDCSEQWPVSPAARDRLAERALDCLRRLEATGGYRRECLFLQGQALRVMERYAEAIVPLTAAAAEAADDIHVWLALGWCHKRTGRLDLAIEALKEALEADPTEAIIYYNLACYWCLAGNTQLALDFLADALEINPNYRDLVNNEPDFDRLRSHPAFLALTSVIV